MKEHGELINQIPSWTDLSGSDTLDANLLERDGELTQTDGIAQLNGRKLRQLRRSRGLSQVELAELLGVTQPNISKWEAGFEKTPARIRDRLKDVLTGYQKNAGNFFSRIAYNDPSLAAYDVKPFSLPIIKLSHKAAGMLSKPHDTYIGEDFRRVFKSDWLDELFQGRPMSDFAMIHFNHDLIPEEPNPRIAAYRVDAKVYVFQPEASTPMIVSRAHFSDPTGQPAQIISSIALEEL